MILSKILYPSKDICQEEELYFKGINCEIADNSVKLNKNSLLSALTYFNSFSLEKWTDYTKLDNLTLSLTLQGKCIVEICNAYFFDDDLKVDVIKSETFSNSNKAVVNIDIGLNYTGIIAFQIKTTDDVCQLLDASYNTVIEDSVLNPVKLAIGTCTYKREEYVMGNLQRLSQRIADENSLLHNRVKVYVSDNGQTLPLKQIENDSVKIFYNKNYGGAGGFTRCMIEAYYEKSLYDYTNFTFLDDDIVLSVDAIEKLIAFLMLLKEEHRQSTIGGAMFSLDERWLQFENGADFVNTNFKFNNRNIDMRVLENVVKNELSAKVRYNAWCCCTIPFNIINDNNLPLPVFFHMDDVEYGLRNNLPIISLNGINVWHLYKRFMPNPKNDYYDIRNKLIMIAELAPSQVAPAIVDYIGYCVSQTLKYHYAQAINGLNGIIDFLKGFEYFKNLDTLKQHSKLFSNITWKDANAKLLNEATVSCVDDTHEIQSLKAIAIKAIKPATKKRKVILKENSMKDCSGCKHIYVVHPVDHKYTKYKKNLFLALKCYLKCVKIRNMVQANYSYVLTEWSGRINELKTMEFWGKYLGIPLKSTNAKRILLVASDNNITSGAFRSMATLAKLLKERHGLFVSVLLPNTGDGQNLLKEYNIPFTLIQSSDWIVRLDSLKEDIVAKKQAIKNLNGKAIKAIEKYIRENKFDLVHINTSYHYVALIAAKHAGVPVIWHIREFLEEDQQRRMLNRKYGYSLMNKADKVVAISDSIEQKYNKLLKQGKVTRIYNGIDETIFYDQNKEILQKEKITLIAVGTIAEYKAQHIVVEAVGKLIKYHDVKNIELMLVGNNVGGYMKTIYSIINEYSLQDYVKILGPRNDVDALYKTADIACVCSVSEAFGRVTVESMMTGCLTIGADSAGTREIIVDGVSGILFKTGDSDDLAQKLLKAINDKENSRKIAKQGKEYAVEKFSANANAENIYNLYTNLLKEQ